MKSVFLQKNQESEKKKQLSYRLKKVDNIINKYKNRRYQSDETISSKRITVYKSENNDTVRNYGDIKTLKENLKLIQSMGASSPTEKVNIKDKIRQSYIRNELSHDVKMDVYRIPPQIEYLNKVLYHENLISKVYRQHLWTYTRFAVGVGVSIYVGLYGLPTSVLSIFPSENISKFFANNKLKVMYLTFSLITAGPISTIVYLGSNYTAQTLIYDFFNDKFAPITATLTGLFINSTISHISQAITTLETNYKTKEEQELLELSQEGIELAKYEARFKLIRERIVFHKGDMELVSKDMDEIDNPQHWFTKLKVMVANFAKGVYSFVFKTLKPYTFMILGGIIVAWYSSIARTLILDYMKTLAFDNLEVFLKGPLFRHLTQFGLISFMPHVVNYILYTVLKLDKIVNSMTDYICKKFNYKPSKITDYRFVESMRKYLCEYYLQEITWDYTIGELFSMITSGVFNSYVVNKGVNYTNEKIFKSIDIYFSTKQTSITELIKAVFKQDIISIENILFSPIILEKGSFLCRNDVREYEVVNNLDNDIPRITLLKRGSPYTVTKNIEIAEDREWLTQFKTQNGTNYNTDALLSYTYKYRIYKLGKDNVNMSFEKLISAGLNESDMLKKELEFLKKQQEAKEVYDIEVYNYKRIESMHMKHLVTYENEKNNMLDLVKSGKKSTFLKIYQTKEQERKGTEPEIVYEDRLKTINKTISETNSYIKEVRTIIDNKSKKLEEIYDSLNKMISDAYTNILSLKKTNFFAINTDFTDHEKKINELKSIDKNSPPQVTIELQKQNDVLKNTNSAEKNDLINKKVHENIKNIQEAAKLSDATTQMKNINTVLQNISKCVSISTKLNNAAMAGFIRKLMYMLESTDNISGYNFTEDEHSTVSGLINELSNNQQLKEPSLEKSLSNKCFTDSYSWNKGKKGPDKEEYRECYQTAIAFRLFGVFISGTTITSTILAAPLGMLTSGIASLFDMLQNNMVTIDNAIKNHDRSTNSSELPILYLLKILGMMNMGTVNEESSKFAFGKLYKSAVYSNGKGLDEYKNIIDEVFKLEQIIMNPRQILKILEVDKLNDPTVSFFGSGGINMLKGGYIGEEYINQILKGIMGSLFLLLRVFKNLFYSPIGMDIFFGMDESSDIRTDVDIFFLEFYRYNELNKKQPNETLPSNYAQYFFENIQNSQNATIFISDIISTMYKHFGLVKLLVTFSFGVVAGTKSYGSIVNRYIVQPSLRYFSS